MIFIFGILICLIVGTLDPETLQNGAMEFVFWGSLVLWLISIPLRIIDKGIGKIQAWRTEVKRKQTLDQINKEMAVRRKIVSDAGIDEMEGHQFEYWCADLLRGVGFQDVHVTQGSGDQGVDIVAVLDGVRWAFQCKRYNSNLGNTPVQEVYAGMEMYNCSVGVVMTNSGFTDGARKLADRIGIKLWGRDKLIELIKTASEGVESKPITEEEIAENRRLPHVPYAEGQREYVYFFCSTSDTPVDAELRLGRPIFTSQDDIVALFSEQVETEEEARHIAQAVEKHFFADAKVFELPGDNGEPVYSVCAKFRARNIMSNFDEEANCFIVPNWA